MFAQLSHYQIKPGDREKCIEIMTKLQPQIMALPGIKQFVNVIADDNSGYVVALIESKTQAEANADKVKMLWAQFADYLERLPTVEGYDVIADWKV